jgi:hypothetical protein
MHTSLKVQQLLMHATYKLFSGKLDPGELNFCVWAPPETPLNRSETFSCLNLIIVSRYGCSSSPVITINSPGVALGIGSK